MFQLNKRNFKKLSVDYRYKNNGISFGCPLSKIINTGKIKPYCLIFNTYHLLYLNEGLVKSYDVNKVKNILQNNKNLFKDLIVPEWLQQIQNIDENVKEQLLEYFPLEKEQIEIINRKHDINFIVIYIPDIAINLQLIEKTMNAFGYFKSDIIKEEVINDIKWVAIQFEPKFQDVITYEIKHNHKYLYHISPTKYEHKILKNGLIPKSKNDKFNYPYRVYLLMDKDNSFNLNKTYLISIAKMLLGSKLNLVNNQYVNDNEYTIYQIDISKLNNNINFYYDTNLYPLSIFTVDNINPNAIKIIDRIKF